MSIHSGQRVEKRADVAAEGSHASAVCDFPLNDRSLPPLPLPPTLPDPRSPEIPPRIDPQTSTRTFHLTPPLFYPSSSVDDPFCAEDRDDSKKRNRYESFHLVPFFAANALILSIFIRIERERVWNEGLRFEAESRPTFVSNVEKLAFPPELATNLLYFGLPVSYIYIRNERNRRVRMEIIPNDNGEILVSRLV